MNIQYFVSGKPTPKGSWNAITIGGKARLIPNNKRSKPWADKVRLVTAMIAGEQDIDPLESAVDVKLTFTFERPKSHFNKTGLNPAGQRFPFPTGAGKQGDIDKLARNVLDAITGILFVDDRQVVNLCCCKEWDMDEGVFIELWETMV